VRKISSTREAPFLTIGKIKICSCEGINQIAQKGVSHIRRLKNMKQINTKQVVVAACYDTDRGNQQSQFDRSKFIEGIKGLDIAPGKIIFCAADRTIEDWILIDAKGVLDFLNLPSDTKIDGKTGKKKLERLYNKKGKTYIDRDDTADLIARLDMGKILNTLTGDAETGIDKLKAVILDGEGLKVENTRRKKAVRK